MKLRQVFQFFDSDATGALTIDEFAMACERVGVPLERRHARMFFTRYDPDGSGSISYDEFVGKLMGEVVA